MLLNRRLRYRPKAYTDDDQIWHSLPPSGIPNRLSARRRELYYRNALQRVTSKQALATAQSPNPDNPFILAESETVYRPWYYQPF